MIWEFIKKKIVSDNRVYLLVVIESHGSSPGRPGFKMALSSDGKMSGSIGGGKMEYKLIEDAKGLFEKENSIFFKRQTHNTKDKTNSSGMICSGSQVVAFYPFDRTYLTLIESISKATSGKLVFSESGILFNREVNSPKEYICDITSDSRWAFTEQLGFKNFLYIFGAGHVSVAVSRIFNQLGFHVTVLDDRDKSLTTFRSNRFAHSKRKIDYSKSAKYVRDGENVYVIIMSFAHKSDGKILRLLLGKNLKYLGMMGSIKKVASVYKKLEKKGISAEKLTRVDAPIGLAINSQTPEEIAISIAAKIISVKNA